MTKLIPAKASKNQRRTKQNNRWQLTSTALEIDPAATFVYILSSFYYLRNKWQVSINQFVNQLRTVLRRDVQLINDTEIPELDNIIP